MVALVSATAFSRGFVRMELAGAFRLGGDVDEAYRFAIDSIVAGLAVMRPEH